MSNSGEMLALTGLAAARGRVSGPVYRLRGDLRVPVSECVVPPDRVAEELARLERARTDVRRDLQGLIAVLRERAGRDDVQVFECHQMFLDDPLLVDGCQDVINRSHLNAEAAVRRTCDAAREQFGRMNDPYFRERVRDLDDVERRILDALTGRAGALGSDLHAPSVIVADDLTPSATVQLPREFVLGFATDGGSATSHVALIARAMGVPAVCGLGTVTEEVQPGETVLLDGTNGVVTVRPDEPTRAAFEQLVESEQENSSVGFGGRPAGTLRDGSSVLLYANVQPGVALDNLRESGARGIGLYRSEYLWLNRGSEPSEEEQFIAYRDAARQAAGLSAKATLTVRLLDIGGDKVVDGITATEPNPFLGNRSLRYLLANRPVLRAQMRAVLRASHYGRVRLMYPMVACVEELRAAADELAAVKRELDAARVPYDAKMPVGAMIEIPSAALNASALAQMVDFFSIGTNDLVQYTLAADRGNEAVAYLCQPANPAVLELVRRTFDAAAARGIPASVCGESAADPVLGPLWVAMGANMLSVSVGYIPVLAKILRRLTRRDLADYAALAAGLDRGIAGAEAYARCRAYLAAKVPDFETLVS